RPACAVDITTCGQTVAANDTGTLQADISGCPYGVIVGDRATLQMNGHSISGTGVNGVSCTGGTCTVVGPGEIFGGNEGIGTSAASPSGRPLRKMTVKSVSVHDMQDAGIVAGLGGNLTLTDVSLARAGQAPALPYEGPAGLYAKKLVATNLTLTDN